MNVIIWIEHSWPLQFIKQIIKQCQASSKHIPPQSFNPLIMCAFPYKKSWNNVKHQAHFQVSKKILQIGIVTNSMSEQLIESFLLSISQLICYLWSYFLCQDPVVGAWAYTRRHPHSPHPCLSVPVMVAHIHQQHWETGQAQLLPCCWLMPKETQVSWNTHRFHRGQLFSTWGQQLDVIKMWCPFNDTQLEIKSVTLTVLA